MYITGSERDIYKNMHLENHWGYGLRICRSADVATDKAVIQL